MRLRHLISPRRLISLTGAIGAICVAPAAAGAAAIPVTTQAQQANAGFLAYAPAPSAGPDGALCVVDTGVHANPDTTAGLLGSYALDGGSTDDADPQGHGTEEAMIAGAHGAGLEGAWPQIKIVSVRETNDPGAGQEPSYEFDDYYQGMQACSSAPAGDHIRAVLLALNSTIPPTPDQAQAFANAVATLNANNVAVVASAGNDSGGVVQEPAAEPGVFAVGADTASAGSVSDTAVGSPCSFSATQGVTFYAPGCGIDEADPFSDQPFCCGDGTSQAAAFAAASLVALMSYDPALSYEKAENLLVQNATDQDLNVGAAFEADGQGTIVTQGNANTPQPAPAPTTTAPSGGTPPTSTSTSTTPTPTTTTTTTTGTTPTAPTSRQAPPQLGQIKLMSVRWKHGRLTITLANLPARSRTRINITVGRTVRRLQIGALTSRMVKTITLKTAKPTRVTVRVFLGVKPLTRTFRRTSF